MSLSGPEKERIVLETTDFVNQFAAESDRACLIIAVAKIDSILKSILEQFLLPNTTNDDPLLDSQNFLGTTYSRTLILNRLGLISNEMAKQLNLLRKIRNDAAHITTKTKFDFNVVSDRIEALHKERIALPGEPVFEKIKSELKSKLLIVITSIIIDLMIVNGDVKRVNPLI